MTNNPQPPHTGQPPHAGEPPYPGQPPHTGQPPHAGEPPYPGQPPQMGYQASHQQSMPQAYPTGKQKVHHSYIWLGSIRLAFTLLFVFVISVIPAFLGGEYGLSRVDMRGGGLITVLLLIIVFIAIIGLTVGLQAISYRHLLYEVGDKEFTLYSGIFNKKQIHVPYQRIQSVNQRATLTQRILGICTVHIDTAGGALNKAVVVPYLKKSEAERLRTELFARKQYLAQGHPSTETAPAQAVSSASAGAPAAASVSVVMRQPGNILDRPAEILSDAPSVFDANRVVQGAVSYEIRMSNKELVLTGLTNATGFGLMLLAFLAAAFGLVSQLLETTIGNRVVNQGIVIANDIFSDNLVWIVAGAAIVGLLIFWLFSVLGTSLSYGGFKASRRQSRIEVEYGVLQHQFHGVDIDRVQSVIIKQSFFRRMIGYCELSLGKIDANDPTQQNQEEQIGIERQRGLVIHPFVKMKKVPEILAGLVPEFADVPTEQKTLPPVSLRRALIRRCILQGNGFWLALVVAITLGFVHVFDSWIIAKTGIANFVMYADWIAIAAFVLTVLIAVVEVVNAVLWFRGSSFAYNGRFLQVTNGGFSRESVSLPRKKIQYSFTQTNPFQRLAHVVTINVRTAAGISGTTMKLLDVSEKDAETWLEWSTPGKAMIK